MRWGKPSQWVKELKDIYSFIKECVRTKKGAENVQK